MNQDAREGLRQAGLIADMAVYDASHGKPALLEGLHKLLASLPYPEDVERAEKPTDE